MATMTKTRIIAGTIQEVWDVVCDMPAFKEFMEDIHKVTILEGSVESGRTITEWYAMHKGAPMVWIEEDLFDANIWEIVYQMVEGDLEQLDGTWKLEAMPDLADGTPQTNVTMVLNYSFGVPELEELVSDAMDVDVAKNCKMMLDGVEQRVAERRRAA